MPKGRKKKWKLERLAVDPTCHYCKKPIKSYKKSSIDHVIPRAKGIDCNDQSNWVLCCKQCNFAKGSLDLEDFLKKLEPKQKEKKKKVKNAS